MFPIEHEYIIRQFGVYCSKYVVKCSIVLTHYFEVFLKLLNLYNEIIKIKLLNLYSKIIKIKLLKLYNNVKHVSY